MIYKLHLKVEQIIKTKGLLQKSKFPYIPQSILTV